MLHFLAARVWISVSPRAPGRKGGTFLSYPHATKARGFRGQPPIPPHQLVLEPPFVTVLYGAPLGGGVSPAETPSRAPKPFHGFHTHSPILGARFLEYWQKQRAFMNTKKTREGLAE